LPPAEIHRTGRFLPTGETVVQINGTGPFDVMYLDPSDDPRRK
jgi:hypothetical protein